MRGPPNFLNYDEFDVFSYGSLFMEDQKLGQIDDCMDTVRYFAEECDSMQGFQSLVDVDSGFGGLAKSIFQEIRDEYSKKPIFAMANSVSNARPAEKSRYSLLNSSLAMASISQFCSVYLPLRSIMHQSSSVRLRFCEYKFGGI